jgi:site-specific DNA-methyltransferase (adenine-specific)
MPRPDQSIRSRDGRYEIFNHEMFHVLALRDEPVQALITDPPYGAVVHQWERAARDRNGEITEAPIEFDPLDPQDRDFLAAFAQEKLQGWAVLFMQTEQLTEWIGAFEQHGPAVKYWRPMVWTKPNARPNFNGNGPGMGFEMMGTWWKGEGRRTWNGGGRVGVFNVYNRKRPGGHQTEKPIELMRELVALFSNPGDTVLDPFMGSGTTGVACLELGRKFIGIEKDPVSFEMAHARLKAQARVRPLLAETPKELSLTGEARYRAGRAAKRTGMVRRAAE